jgi:hypothetical protein
MCAICCGRAVARRPLNLRSHTLDTVMKLTSRLVVKDTHAGRRPRGCFSLSSSFVGSSLPDKIPTSLHFPKLQVISTRVQHTISSTSSSVRYSLNGVGRSSQFWRKRRYEYMSMHCSHTCGVEGRQARGISRREEQWRRQHTNIMRINGTCRPTQKVKYQNLVYF